MMCKKWMSQEDVDEANAEADERLGEEQPACDDINYQEECGR